MELISIIVPVYKVEKYLNKCVQSIVDQSYINLEIILVDDGSPDQCPEMCDNWAKREERVKVIHKKNGGLSDARNEGMKAATGNYIGFVDSDDYIAPEMLERLYNSMRENDADIAACSVEMIWENHSERSYLTPRINEVLNAEKAQSELLHENKLKQPVWYKLYKRKIIKDLPFEVGKYHEDVYWSYQAIGRAKKISIIDYVGYFYLQRGSSIMGVDYSLKRLDAIEAYCRRCSYMEANFPELFIESKVSLTANCLYHGQMSLKYLNKDEKRKALAYLKKIHQRNLLQINKYPDKKFSHRLWYFMEHISFEGTCKLRNLLKIGM